MPVHDLASMANLYNQLGLALAGDGQFGPAVEAFENGMRYRDGAEAELVVNLSTLLRRNGELEKASKVLSDVMKAILEKGAQMGEGFKNDICPLI